MVCVVVGGGSGVYGRRGREWCAWQEEEGVVCMIGVGGSGVHGRRGREWCAW